LALFLDSVSPDDAAILESKLREADYQEAQAQLGLFANRCVSISLESSFCAWTLRDDQTFQPVACIGLADPPDPNEAGTIIWMLGSDEIEQHTTQFLRHSRAVVQSLLMEYDYLHNWVDSRNTKHIEWLKWCGFNVCPSEAQEVGPDNIPFYPFYQGVAQLCA